MKEAVGRKPSDFAAPDGLRRTAKNGNLFPRGPKFLRRHRKGDNSKSLVDVHFIVLIGVDCWSCLWDSSRSGSLFFISDTLVFNGSMHINSRAQISKFCLALALLSCSLLLGCAQLQPLQQTRFLPKPSSGQLGVSPGARAIENNLGVD